GGLGRLGADGWGAGLAHNVKATGYDGPPSALANPGGNAIMALSANVRRVVTTIDSKDKAVVLLDGANPHKKVRPQAQTVSRLLWVTDQTPADLAGRAHRAA